MQLNLIAATLFILTTLSLKAEKLDTLGAPIINEFTQTICRGDVFEGYTFVGTYQDTFTTGTCDSIRVLHLRYFSPTFETRSLICVKDGDPNPPSFGTFIEARIDTNGCEFMHETTVAPVPADKTTNATICQGESYTPETGDMPLDRDTLVAFEERTDQGCIFINYLNLTVLESEEPVIENIAICQGEEFEWQGQIYSEPGHYTQVNYNANGCSGYLILNLSFRPAGKCFGPAGPGGGLYTLNSSPTTKHTTAEGQWISQQNHQSTFSSTALPDSQPIRLYPNPSSDFITVDGLASSQESHHVQLINIQGQVVASYSTKLSKLRMDLSSLANGIYITKISTENSKAIKTISFLKK